MTYKICILKIYLTIEQSIKGKRVNPVLLNQPKGNYLIEISDSMGRNIVKKIIIE
jgi:hypothetical protein